MYQKGSELGYYLSFHSLLLLSIISKIFLASLLSIAMSADCKRFFRPQYIDSVYVSSVRASVKYELI